MPDLMDDSTPPAERANWTLRGHLRRFTRLSNGFSRKKANLRAALALYFAYYNFVRMHKSIRMTPAMARRSEPDALEHGGPSKPGSRFPNACNWLASCLLRFS
jgi:hypothetical protein